MNNLTTYISEKLKIKNVFMFEKLKISSKMYKGYSCQPKDKFELREILKKRLAQDKNANLNDIDVSEITDMEDLFYGLDPHNIKIDAWDVSNVKNMENMFAYCSNFNCDLSKWNMSMVENISFMFAYCSNFKGKGLENWDVSNIKNMFFPFTDCPAMKRKPNWWWNNNK